MHIFFTTIIIKVFPLFAAIVLHEIAHGLMAYFLGDDTAKREGRFNLHTHFDFYGSFVIPLALYLLNSPFLIGYAKPIPINQNNFKDPLSDMALVAIAGPLCNLLMAAGAAFLIQHTHTIWQEIILQMMLNFMVINLAVMFFNLIPIPPLDASRLLAAVMPKAWVEKFYIIEPFGCFIVISLDLFTSQLSRLMGSQFSLFYLFIHRPVRGMMEFLLS